MNRFDRLFPPAVIGLVALYLFSQALPHSYKPNEPNLEAARNIPVLDGGRVKPLDTLARVSLMSISSRSEFEDLNGKMQPAIVWLIDLLSSPSEAGSPAAEYKVFRIENDQVLNFLNVKNRPGSYRYSLKEILGNRAQTARLKKEFDRLDAMDSKKFTLFDAKIAELSKKVNLYLSLTQRRVPLGVPPQKDGEEWLSIAQIDRTNTAPFEEKARQLAQNDVLKPIVDNGIKIDTLSPEEKDELRGEIESRTHQHLVILAEELRPDQSPAAAAYLAIFRDYRLGSAQDFNGALTAYQKDYLSRVSESDKNKVQLETWFNQFSPFNQCLALFVVVFVFGACSWLGWSEPLNGAASWLMIFTLCLHTFAILVRMYLQGRPPVTNLYSSAIFIGWGAVGVSILLERWYRNGVGNVVGAVIGFATLKIADHLGASGDSLEMMQAVLDTNFWLATHVTCVTLGYTATFVAGIIGIVYILWGIFFKSLNGAASKKISQMLYGVICFATLLSFVGTVLGGIWADQSWGRFWGWDPKENGAVLIVLWNVLILHARWGGFARQRGIAVLAIVGNMITAWSWFGTNQLGVGLHNYGFNKSLADGCRYFWYSQLALVAIGLLPLKYWRSFSPETIRERAALAKEQQEFAKRQSKGSITA